MAVKITGIRREGVTPENPHLGISIFAWINEKTQATGHTTRQDMYDWIVNRGGSAYIRDASGNNVYVFGAKTASGEKYIQAAKDKQWTNDLLGLPVI